MSDILTPEEVDALLSGVAKGQIETSTGVGPTTDVTEFDLTANEHITKDRMPAMDLINQVFARQFETSMRGLLRAAIEVKHGETTLQRYGDYLATLDFPTNLNLLRSDSMATQLLFVLDTKMVLNYVDMSFGGDGHQGDEPVERDFTPTEVGVAARLVKRAMSDMADAWSDITNLGLESVRSETNPEFSNFFAPNEEMVVSRFDITLEEEALGTLVIAIPNPALTPVKEILDASDQREARVQWSTMLERQLRQTEVEVSSVLATTRLRLCDLVRLSPGDILPIDVPATVEISAGDIKLFAGSFGISNGHNAIQITERLSGGETSDSKGEADPQ